MCLIVRNSSFLLFIPWAISFFGIFNLDSYTTCFSVFCYVLYVSIKRSSVIKIAFGKWLLGSMLIPRGIFYLNSFDFLYYWKFW